MVGAKALDRGKKASPVLIPLIGLLVANRRGIGNAFALLRSQKAGDFCRNGAGGFDWSAASQAGLLAGRGSSDAILTALD